MSDIRYICLSDLHFGAETSVLTNLKKPDGEIDPLNPSPVMIQLVECLKTLISGNGNQAQKPTLILNGDFLELALATTNEALMVFERFVELTMPSGEELFDGIHIIPGNHDHHLWETARETSYAEYMKGVNPGDLLAVPYHVTNIFKDPMKDPIPSYLLTRLVRRFPHLGDKKMLIEASYPNYGIMADDEQKCVIFHHGHFTESIYELMSALKTMLFPKTQMPQHIWDLEEENFAWIDFFWSAMGRSGDVGEDVAKVYERLQDPKQFKKLLTNFAGSLAKRYNLPGWGNRIGKWFMKRLLHKAADILRGNLESHQSDEPFTESIKKGLTAYMEGPLNDQFHEERTPNASDYDISADVTFVFGHTHRPFARDMDPLKGYNGSVDIYNTGGWVVGNVEVQPTHGGAIILIDEDLDTVSVCMYKEADSADDYRVKVEYSGETATAFQEQIDDLINPDAVPWKIFSEEVAPALDERKIYMKKRINA